MAKKAVITGITGQDGSYLAELLLEKGYEVYGMVRRLSLENYERIEHILDDIELVDGDLLDEYSIMRRRSSAAARRGLQPRGAVVRADVVHAADADRAVRRARACCAGWRRSSA